MPGTGGWALHTLSLPVFPESSKVDGLLRLTRVTPGPRPPWTADPGPPDLYLPLSHHSLLLSPVLWPSLAPPCPRADPARL